MTLLSTNQTQALCHMTVNYQSDMGTVSYKHNYPTERETTSEHVELCFIFGFTSNQKKKLFTMAKQNSFNVMNGANVVNARHTLTYCYRYREAAILWVNSLVFLLFLHQNIHCEYSSELPLIYSHDTHTHRAR